jgi:hypothetical protein
MRRWGEERDWRGYDPYDGLNSSAARWLSLGSPLGRRLVTQAVKLSPLNLRPMLRIQPEWNAKAVALVASAYARVAAADGDESAAAHAARWLDWLVANRSENELMAWGYHFEVQTRVFSYPRGEPNTIATSFVAQALLDGCELLEGDRWREPARRAAAFLATEMLDDGGGAPYFRYLREENALIHNANLLACAVLSRAGRVLADVTFSEITAAALRTTLAAQRDDGSWPYGEAPGQQWVDNFHTGYVLESLAACEGLEVEVREQLERGVAYWQRELFLPDGTPKYFPDRTYPLDAHCYAQAVETWLALEASHPDALINAAAAAQLLIDRLLDRRGHVHFQKRRLWTNKVPFVRWTTAPSFRALAGVMLRSPVSLAQET